MGFSFPLANAVIQRAESSVGRRAGVLYLANTAGAVCGSLAAGFVAGTAALPESTWVLAAVVLVGGWLGAEYGSRRFANPVVRRVLAVVLAVAGAKMVFV